MCHFVMLLTPPGADLEKVDAVLRRFQRSVYVVENRHVTAVMKADETYFCAMPGHCDCGTSLGRAADLDDDDADGRLKRLNKTLAAYRRKGWSEAKIDRWLKDSNKAADKNKFEPCANGPDEWPALIRALMSEMGLPYVGILLFWASGGFDSTPKNVTREHFLLDEDLGSRLYGMKEDVLYVVEAR